ncbi:hypothetical protein FACS189449_05930 [Alphaproteobacteria bacterium]|nr:hypothetical protein FACS189449_05930 [Alphaproteobacteria bacterium]
MNKTMCAIKAIICALSIVMVAPLYASTLFINTQGGSCCNVTINGSLDNPSSWRKLVSEFGS